MTDLEYFETATKIRQVAPHPTTGNTKGFNVGDFVAAVMGIDNKQDATRFYNGYIEWLNSIPKPDEEKYKSLTADQVAKANISTVFFDGMAQDKIDMWEEALIQKTGSKQ